MPIPGDPRANPLVERGYQQLLGQNPPQHRERLAKDYLRLMAPVMPARAALQKRAASTGMPGGHNFFAGLSDAQLKSVVNDPSQYIRTSPNLVKYLTRDPNNAAISRDDLEKLDFLSRTAVGFEIGWLEDKVGRLERSLRSLVDPNRVQSVQMLNAQLDALRTSQGDMSLTGSAVPGAAKILGQQIHSIPSIAGPAAAALSLRAFGVPVSPGLALRFGIGVSTAEVESGGIISALARLKDENGKPIPVPVRNFYANVGGAVNGFLEAAFLGTLGPAVKNIPGLSKAVQAVTARGVTKAIASKTVRQAVLRTLGESAVGAAGELITEDMQEVVAVAMDLAAQETTDAAYSTEFNPSVAAHLRQAGEQIKAINRDFGPGIILLSALPLGYNIPLTVRNQKRVQATDVIRKEVNRKAHDTVTAKESPEALEEVLLTTRMGQSTTFVPGAAAMELLQDETIAEELQNVIPIAEAEEAAAADRDIWISEAKLQTLSPEVFERIADVSRMDPGAVSLQELGTMGAADVSKYVDRFTEQGETAAKLELALDSLQKGLTGLRGKLKGVPISDLSVRAISKLFREFTRNWIDAGLNPEYVERINIQVEQDPEVARELLARVKDGEQILDQEVFVSLEQDAQYQDAVKAGDLETATKMVTAAAKRAGYTIKAYHGGQSLTGAIDFTVFEPRKGGRLTQSESRPAVFFSPNESWAQQFAEFQASAEGTQPFVIQAFLKVENPVLKDSTEESVNKLRARGVTGTINKDVESGEIIEYAVFNPNQIKLADPVTFRKDGTVIPLSERFNPEQADIRFQEDSTPIAQLRIEPETEADQTFFQAYPETWTVDQKLEIFRAVNNRLSKELEVLERLLGPIKGALDLVSVKDQKGQPVQKRSIFARDLLEALHAAKESGWLKRLVVDDVNTLADELELKGKERTAFKEEVRSLRAGSIFDKKFNPDRGILADNSKAGGSVDILLATCQPTTPCRECYAAKSMIRMSNVRKAIRTTTHILLDPEGFGKLVAEEARRKSKLSMPFIRLLGSGDITSSETVDAFNAIAEHADRPIHIFSRHHEHLAKLQGTKVAPFLKMGSVDIDLYKYYNDTFGPEYLRENLLKRGINNAWLYTDVRELGAILDLAREKKDEAGNVLEPGALGLILSAKPELHAGLPQQLRRSSCPCDAGERHHTGSCRQCLLGNQACFMMFADKGYDEKGGVYLISEMPPEGKAFLDFFSDVKIPKGSTTKAAFYSKITQDIIQQSISLINLNFRKYTERITTVGVNLTKNKKWAAELKAGLSAARWKKAQAGKSIDISGKIFDKFSPGLQKKIRANSKRGAAGVTFKDIRYEDSEMRVVDIAEYLARNPKLTKADLVESPSLMYRTEKQLTAITAQQIDLYNGAKQRAKEGTFYLPGGEIQAPVAYRAWQFLPDAVSLTVGEAQTLFQADEAITLLQGESPIEVLDALEDTPSELRESTAKEGASEFKTGQPVTFSFVRNEESATSFFGVPDLEAPFARGFEPAGRFVTPLAGVPAQLADTQTSGEITFQNPLVIEFGGQYDQATNWKRRLSKAFGGLTGTPLSQAIIAAGHDGVVTTREGETLETLDFTTFNADLALFQEEGEAAKPPLPKGALTITKQEYLMRLFHKADLSTILHETGHIFLEEMFQLSQISGDERFLSLWADISEWLDIQPGQTALTREQQEKFAEHFEAYLRGENTKATPAPSAALREVFGAFRSWLMNIYTNIQDIARGDRSIELDDDVRSIFDRMLATERDIETSQLLEDIMPVDEGSLVGVAQEDKNALARLAAKAKRAWKERVHTRRAKLRTRLEKVWRKAAQDQVEHERVYLLRDDLVENGGIQFNELEEEFGVAIANQIKAKRRGLTRESQGRFPAAVAAQNGYDSVGEMVNDLLESPTKEERVQQLVDIKAAEFESEAAIDDEAAELTSILEYLEKLEKSLRKAVGRKVGIAERQAIKVHVQNEMNATPVKDALHTSAYLGELKRMAREKDRAMLGEKGREGDTGLEDAIKITSNMRKQFERVRQSQRLREKFTKLLTRKLPKALGSRPGQIEQEHLKNAWQLAWRFGLTKKPPVFAEKMSLTNVLGQRFDEEGVSLVDARPEWSDFLLDENIAKDYRELDVADATEVIHLIDALIGRGRAAVQARNAYTRLSVERIVDEAIQPALELPDITNVPREGRTTSQVIVALKQKYLNSLRNLREFMVAMDNYNLRPESARGPNMRYIYDSLADAQSRRLLLQGVVESALKGPMNVLDARRRQMADSVAPQLPFPALLKKRGDQYWTFDHAVSIALNLGNSYNRNALYSGYPDLTPQTVDALLTATLGPQEWAAVQDIWKAVNSVWPMVADTFFKLNYYEATKVQAEPFTTPTGERLEGGYFPVVFDPSTRSGSVDNTQLDLVEITKTLTKSTSTKKGATIQRTGTGGRNLLLSASTVIPQHVRTILDYVTMTIPVRDAYRVISSSDYHDTLDAKFGSTAFEDIKTILSNMARGNIKSYTFGDLLANRVRKLSTLYALGWNLSTSSKQFLSIFGFINDFDAATYLRGVRAATDPLNREKMRRLSPFMEQRGNLVDEDITSQIANFGAKQNWAKETIERVQSLAFFPLKLVDILTVTPMWLGVYEKTLEESGGDDILAIRTADDAIAASQPANRKVDLAAIQITEQGWNRMWTMFFSFTIRFGQRSRMAVNAYQQGQISAPDLVKRGMMEWLAPIALMNAWGIITALLTDDDDKDEKEAVLKLMSDTALYPFAGYPVFRDIGRFALGKLRGGRARLTTPAESAVFTTDRFVDNLRKWVRDGGEEGRFQQAVGSTISLVSYWTGVPAHRVWKYLEKLWEEDER